MVSLVLAIFILQVILVLKVPLSEGRNNESNGFIQWGCG